MILIAFSVAYRGLSSALLHMNIVSPMAASNENSSKGGWIGIDLGTSNCTAAVWDISRSRCKVLRLGHKNLARPPADMGSRKGGKIVPSAVLFRRDDECDHPNGASKNCSVEGLSSLVGYAAIQSANETKGDEKSIKRDISTALVTSFKRVVGMTSRQAEELRSSDSDFWNSLPFQSVIMGRKPDKAGIEEHNKQQGQNDDQVHLDDKFFDVLGDTAINNAQSKSPSQPQHDMKEGVAIKIYPLNTLHPPSNSSHNSTEHLVTPLQATTILLRSILDAASEYLINNNKSKIKAPGLNDSSQSIRNCIIGVPAHYSHAQRTAIQNAAKNAGFTGQVGVMTESTAAAMAYGLFVSPTVPSVPTGDSPANDKTREKNILVFDMGGGTTDVTIATIEFGQTDKVQFRVLATAGDRCLGGDNVDELLARHIWKQHASSLTNDSAWKASDHQVFIGACRRAKEELCGNDKDGSSHATGLSETQLTLSKKTIKITRQEFDCAILPLVDRAEAVVDDALSVLESHHHSNVIHEVVLVGGSTHIPTIRSMLRRKFPPPIPPELCTSISAETAVAQGLAIQAALVSGLVPLWELRNAMMLDVLPHSIGVWVINGNQHSEDAGKGAPFTKGQIIQPNDNKSHHGHYIQILEKDAPLPARGSFTFTLATAGQSGVTVIAVEQIGPGDVFQCLGVFDFLLRRFDNAGDGSDGQEARQVEIGMTLETSGKFIVSVFDESDPEHREKRRRYLKEKASGGNLEERVNSSQEEQDERPACSGTEIALSIFCLVFFSLYVAARIAFSDVEILNVDTEL